MNTVRACRGAVAEMSRRTILQGFAGLLLSGPSTALAGGTRPQGVEPVDSAFSASSTLRDISLPDLAGHPTRLGTDAAPRTLLHVFATWCEPCRAELPRLAAYVREAGGTALYAVALAEPPVRVAQFLAALGLDLRVTLDADRRLSRALGVDQLPTTFLLDAALVPRWVVRGDLDWSQPAVRRWLAAPA